jgi:uncharacterized OsmC-like protein
MGVIIEGTYLGKKKSKLIHTPSGTEIVTAAPRDNFGDGSSFSPTDLVAGALGACMMTLIGIVGERDGIDLSGMKMRVEKEMEGQPRRIGMLYVVLHLPRNLPEADRGKLERAAMTCPVHHSLSTDTEIDAKFVYDLE